jgi:hypothetical protein
MKCISGFSLTPKFVQFDTQIYKPFLFSYIVWGLLNPLLSRKTPTTYCSPENTFLQISKYQTGARLWQKLVFVEKMPQAPSIGHGEKWPCLRPLAAINMMVRNLVEGHQKNLSVNSRAYIIYTLHVYTHISPHTEMTLIGQERSYEWINN